MVDVNVQEWLWGQKFRPKTIEDCVLPSHIKDKLLSFVSGGRIPTMLLCGTQGTGKTTAALAMCDQVGADYIMINGSLDLNLETIRTTIQQFASTVSFSEGHKVVILDEFDNASGNHVQPALRNFMEEYSKSCSFIMTANFKHKLIEPLISRCAVVDFTFIPSEKPKLAAQFFKRVCSILDSENVTYDKRVVAELVSQMFPDFRRTLNQLQMYAVGGTIDIGILSTLEDKPFKDLIEILKDKNFTKMRKWVADNTSIDHARLYRELFDKSTDLLVPKSIPELVLLLARYQYQNAFVSDRDINTAALLTEIMLTVEWK